MRDNNLFKLNSSGSLFGNLGSTTNNSLFSLGAPQSNQNNQSTFSIPTNSTNQNNSNKLFGLNLESNGSLFGNKTSLQQPQNNSNKLFGLNLESNGSLFGNKTFLQQPQNNSNSLFGEKLESKGNLFDNKTSLQQPQNNLSHFSGLSGLANQKKENTNSLFGGAASSNIPSIFNNNNKESPFMSNNFAIKQEPEKKSNTSFFSSKGLSDNLNITFGNPSIINTSLLNNNKEEKESEIDRDEHIQSEKKNYVKELNVDPLNKESINNDKVYIESIENQLNELRNQIEKDLNNFDKSTQKLNETEGNFFDLLLSASNFISLLDIMENDTNNTMKQLLKTETEQEIILKKLDQMCSKLKKEYEGKSIVEGIVSSIDKMKEQGSNIIENITEKFEKEINEDNDEYEEMINVTKMHGLLKGIFNKILKIQKEELKLINSLYPK